MEKGVEHLGNWPQASVTVNDSCCRMRKPDFNRDDGDNNLDDPDCNRRGCDCQINGCDCCLNGSDCYRKYYADNRERSDCNEAGIDAREESINRVLESSCCNSPGYCHYQSVFCNGKKYPALLRSVLPAKYAMAKAFINRIR